MFLCTCIYCFIAKTFENARKGRPIDRSMRPGDGVCVCVCGRGKKKTVIFFFFFAASLRQVLQSGDKKNSPRRSFFKRRSALGSLVFVPGVHAMTVEISRRWSLLGGVCVCVCVSGGPATVPHTPTAGGANAHPASASEPHSPGPILSFHPGEEEEGRGGGTTTVFCKERRCKKH